MVTLIGMGSGKWEALSAQAQQAVRSAGLVFGAKRLLAGLPADCTARQFALYQPADILETLAQNPGQDAAVLYSGDTGFYSGASGLLTPLRALGIPARVYPGVSSIQLLSAALGRPWQDWKLVSAHGCACDPVAECMMNRSVFFLTCCAGKAGGNAYRHSVGCGRRHRQCERGACAGGTQRPRLRRGM